MFALHVASTTSATLSQPWWIFDCLLLIYRFQFRSTFQSRAAVSARSAPSVPSLIFSISFSDRWTFFIRWPWPLTYAWLSDELDLDRVKMSHHVRYLGQCSFWSKLIVRTHRHTHTHTHTHTYQTDFSTRPLKRSVNIASVKLAIGCHLLAPLIHRQTTIKIRCILASNRWRCAWQKMPTSRAVSSRLSARLLDNSRMPPATLHA